MNPNREPDEPRETNSEPFFRNCRLVTLFIVFGVGFVLYLPLFGGPSLFAPEVQFKASFFFLGTAVVTWAAAEMEIRAGQIAHRPKPEKPAAPIDPFDSYIHEEQA